VLIDVLVIENVGKMKCKIYIRDGCGYCSAAIEFLQTKQIPFSIHNRDEDDFTQNWFEEEFGVWATYPQIIMWDKTIGGYTDLLQYAEECMEGVGNGS